MWFQLKIALASTAEKTVRTQGNGYFYFFFVLQQSKHNGYLKKEWKNEKSNKKKHHEAEDAARGVRGSRLSGG